MRTRKVSPSASRILGLGERLDIDGYERLRRPWTLQRLSKDAWWVEVRGFQATVVVAESGVLVFDPLAGSRADHLLAAIRQLTNRPVEAVVYSHHHIDHIGDAAVFKAAFPGVELIATPGCAVAIRGHEVGVPAPTRVLDADEGSFAWRGREIAYGRAPGHCPDNSWFLLPEAGVLHCVDMIHPGGLEFESFGLAQDLWLYESTLARLAELEWRVMVAGHREIGFPSDLQLVRDYLAELRQHARTAGQRVPAARFADPSVAPHLWPIERKRAVVEWIVEAMAPNWGEWPQFPDVARSHAAAMFDDTEHFGCGTARAGTD